MPYAALDHSRLLPHAFMWVGIAVDNWDQLDVVSFHSQVPLP
jgi:hypothetical protein